jgi:hypothetical protein
VAEEITAATKQRGTSFLFGGLGVPWQKLAVQRQPRMRGQSRWIDQDIGLCLGDNEYFGGEILWCPFWCPFVFEKGAVSCGAVPRFRSV